jgi:hypothetical protein
MSEKIGHEYACEMIARLGTVPSGSRMMDAVFVEQCKAFKDGDPVRFLLDLRDELVFSGGCADNIITIISAVLSAYPAETPAQSVTRRAELRERRKAGGNA